MTDTQFWTEMFRSSSCSLGPRHSPVSSSLMMKEGDRETSETPTLQQEDPGGKKQPDQLLRKQRAFLSVSGERQLEHWSLMTAAFKTHVHQSWEREDDIFWMVQVSNIGTKEKKSKNSRQRRHKPQWNKPKNDRVSYFKKHTSPIDQTQGSNVLRKLVIAKQKCPVIHTALKEAVVNSWHSINKK